MAIEIFSGTLAECNAVIAKANAAMGYSAGTSIDVPSEIDASADEYEVVVKVGKQKNALNTSEISKVTATRSFEAKDKLQAKVLIDVKQIFPKYKEVTSLKLIDSGKGTISAGRTNTLTATVMPSDAGQVKLNWKSSDTSKATVENTDGLTCLVTADRKASGTVTIKCNSTDGSRVSASVTLRIR
jgi:hypothetical protein